MSFSSEYAVVFEPFTRNHYAKMFEKKYKYAWIITERAIGAVLARADALLAHRIDKLDKIKECAGGIVYKYDFSVAGTNVSPKKAGNRCIVLFQKQERTVRVLLVYGKTHVVGSNETLWWKGIVKKQYPEYCSDL